MKHLFSIRDLAVVDFPRDTVCQYERRSATTTAPQLTVSVIVSSGSPHPTSGIDSLETFCEALLEVRLSLHLLGA
jgi:hypothetical protein